MGAQSLSTQLPNRKPRQAHGSAVIRKTPSVLISWNLDIGPIESVSHLVILVTKPAKEILRPQAVGSLFASLGG